MKQYSFDENGFCFNLITAATEMLKEEKKFEGEQNVLPPNMTLCQEVYFELKAIKTWQIQEKLFTSSQLPKFTSERGL